MMRLRALVAIGLPLLAAGPAGAQSLFATRGLGVPAPAVDARAAALGGIGVGLIGFHTSLVNPAELAGLSRRGVAAALQPVSSNSTVDGADGGTAGARFPVMRIIYPVSDRLVGSIGYGSYLEQSWAISTESQVTLGDRTISVTDLMRSTGGIAQLQLAASYNVSPTFAIGGGAGLLTGNVERVAARAFVDSAGELRPFSDLRRWEYFAPVATAGFRWDLPGVARLAASVMAGADLEAHAKAGDAEDHTFGAPLEVTVGASARLSSILTANAGFAWARTPEGGEETVSDAVMRIGGGLEYHGVGTATRAYPIRLGARWSQLPYRFENESEPKEFALGVGMGFLLGDPTDPAAVADLSIERASRSGLAGATLSDGLEERLWRFTFSLSLFGR